MTGTPRIRLSANIKAVRRGRELSRERIEYIIKSYGYQYSDFEENLNKEELRDQVIDTCIEKIKKLNDFKLSIVKNLLGSF